METTDKKRAQPQNRRARRPQARGRYAKQAIAAKDVRVVEARRKNPTVKKVTEPGQDRLLKAVGQRGTDPRSPQKQTPNSIQNSLVVSGYTTTLPVLAEAQNRAISYVAMGIVLKALKNGYQWKNGPTGISPYNAFLRIISILRSYMNGAEPLLTNAPSWFWTLCHAIKPKIVPFKTGQVRYDWTIFETGNGDDVTFSLSGGQPYYIFWGVSGLSETTVNGFQILTPPPITTEEAQIESLQDLFGWFNSTYGHKLTTTPVFDVDSDTSAFTAVYPELGSSFFTPGGAKTTIYSERQVDCPILAKFATYQPLTSAQYRGWQKGGTSGGSSCYLGARMSELTTEDMWKNKTSPIFKFYNFDEFYEVLSFILGMAMENSSFISGIQSIPCPLTPFQVQMILRQSLIPFFSNEMAQDLSYEAQWELMQPFTVGPNGVASGRLPMMVPTFFAENVRSVARITTKLKSRVKADRQILDLVPILGRYASEPQLGQYQFDLNGVTTLVYTQDPTELPVNLVDLSATVDQAQVFLDANGRNTASLIALWNEWIQKFSNVLSPLVPLTPGPGTPCLMTNIYTNLQVSTNLPGADPPPTPANVSAKKLPFKKKHFGSAPVTMKQSSVAAVEGTTYFNRVADVRITAQIGILGALAPYIKLFILPVNKPLEDENAQTSFQSLQAWQVEPGFLNRSSALGEAAGVGTYNLEVSSETRHRLMAAVDVKQTFSDGNNELIENLVHLQKEGEGGFFTAIADLVAGVTGIPVGPIGRMLDG
jgi:hypothetical protein